MERERTVPSRNFVTGLHFEVETRTFTWTIEGFQCIRTHELLIDSQVIDFPAGETTGHPSEWTVFLMETLKDEKRWIGICLQLKSPLNPTEDNFKASHLEIRFTIKDNQGGIVKDKGTSLRHVLTEFGEDRSWGFPEFIDADDGNFCPEESLQIQITFKLYIPCLPKSTSSLEDIVEKFGVTFLENFTRDFAGLLKQESPALCPCTDIKIISSDKEEFSVPRGILLVRSDVFAAMLSSNMIEASSGVIQLPDMSSTSLQVLLTFLNKGELHPDWNQTEVLVELTNAAGKYQLPDLLQFLDATLGKVCKVENVLELFTLAHQLSLKTAEEELSKFISVHSVSPELCCKMLKGIMSVPGLNGSVDSFSKRKSRSWKFLSSFKYYVNYLIFNLGVTLCSWPFLKSVDFFGKNKYCS